MIIAEISQNFTCLAEAKELVRLAKESGADLAKAQLFDGMKLYGKKVPAELSFENAKALFDYGASMGIEVFFSVFDIERVKWCEEIGVKRYKLACGFVNARTKKNYDVGQAIIDTGKELIMSFSRIPDFPQYTYVPVKLLYCVPQYPAHFADVDFHAIEEMHGFSDHTIGIHAAKIALARGAQIIEKHFAIDHKTGVDAEWSMTPSELRELKRRETLVGQVL